MAFSEAALSQVMLEAASRARIGVLVTHREGELFRTVYASPVAAELLRSTPAGLVARDAKLMVSAADQAEAIRISTAVRSGQAVPMPFEMTVQRVDGTSFAAELAVTPMAFGGVTYMISFFWSVESRRAAQDQVRQLDAMYRAVLEAAPDGVVISRNGAVLWANDAAAAILGLPDAKAVAGLPLHEILSPEDAQVMRERIESSRKGEKLAPREYRAVRPDGREVTVEIRSIHIVWEGQPAVLAIARDVTERAQMQARLAQTDRLTALGTLAAGVAHEINNPMAAVIFGLEGFERMLKRPQLDEKARADLRSLLGDLKRSAERVTSIVRDLRVFSRGGDESIGPVELRLAVEAANRIAGHVIRARAALEVELAADLPQVRGNLARLEQVMVNLLVNALQAMPEERAAELNRVTVRARVEALHVALEVEDNGTGIPPEALSHVFEPFFTTKPVDVGTGLGLSICHGIVQQLGGELFVARTGPAGTTLAMRLRRADV